jgi:hypothetical protein
MQEKNTSAYTTEALDMDGRLGGAVDDAEEVSGSDDSTSVAPVMAEKASTVSQQDGDYGLSENVKSWSDASLVLLLLSSNFQEQR